MNVTLTSVLAIWGAALSTITFVWNVWKWRRENPRIAVKVEALESHETDGFRGISYELRNRGGKMTTIEEIMLVKYQPGFWGLLGLYEHCRYESQASRKSVKLPVALQPGGVWNGYTQIAEERSLTGMDTNDLILKGRLFYKIRCAHTDRLISGKVKPERVSMRI